VAQMRNELAIAGYPNWQWASEAEIVSVYGRTSGSAVSLCAPSSPQPAPSPPPPTSRYYARDASDNLVSQSQAQSGTGGPLYYFINDNGTSLRAVVDANGTIAGLLLYNPGGNLLGQSTDWVLIGNYYNSNTGTQLLIGEQISAATLGTYSQPSRTFAVTTGACLNLSLFGSALFGTVSLCPTAASNGSAALLLSYGGGGSSALIGGGLGLGLQASSGNSVEDLTGTFAIGGVAAALGPGLTVDGFKGSGTSGQPVLGGDFSIGVGGQLSVPFTPGIEVHGGATNTVIVGHAIVLPTPVTSFLFGS